VGHGTFVQQQLRLSVTAGDVGTDKSIGSGAIFSQTGSMTASSGDHWCQLKCKMEENSVAQCGWCL